MEDSGTILDTVVAAAKYFVEALGKNVTLAVADREKYLFYFEGVVKLGLGVGEKFREGSASDRVIRTGQRSVVLIPEEKYGVPFLAMASPIKNEHGEVVGCIAISIPTIKQEELKKMAAELESYCGGLSSSAAEMAASAQQIANNNAKLAQNAQSVREDIQNLDSVLSLIQEVAEQTHLLGINAAIEAARAGEQGRGFSVVANEIRKMAAKTRSSVKDSAGMLENIKENILDITRMIEEMVASSQEQAAESEEISALIAELEKMIGKMRKMAMEYDF